MHPYLLRVPLPWGGELKIASYGVAIVCGFLLALYIAQRRARRVGIDPYDIFDAAVAGLIGGVVGARVLHVLYEWPYFRAHPLEVIRIDKGGLVFYGGVIGGSCALLFVLVRRKVPLLRALDVVASVVPLGHAFGRIGCFLNGCCFGRETGCLFGLRFPRFLAPGNVDNPLYNVGGQHITGSLPFLHQLQQHPELRTAAWSYPLHPTQLYAVAYNLLIFAVLSYWFPRRWREGEVGGLYLVLYGTARFVNEFFRVEPKVVLGLTVAQAMSVLAVAFGAFLVARARRRQRQPLPAPWEPPTPRAVGRQRKA